MTHRIRAIIECYAPPFYIQRKWMGIWWVNVAKAYSVEEAEKLLKQIRELEAM